jgi:H+/Cl- antiporter ClcA
MTSIFSRSPVNNEAKITTLSERITSFLKQLPLSAEILMLLSALLIGGCSGLLMVIFHKLIDLFQYLSFNQLLGIISQGGAWTAVAIPALGGLIIGILRHFFPKFLKGELSPLLNGARPQKTSIFRPVIKMLAAAISLGTGASLGPEGPSVEIGSNIGVLLGQALQVSKERYRLLLGAGAAAGIAAGFNAPVAGVFFALEVVLGPKFSTPIMSLILLAGVISSVITQAFLGVNPAFNLPNYELLNPWEWFYYLGIGILASVVSLVFTQSIRFSQAAFRGEITFFAPFANKIHPIFKPVLGGLFVGILALKFPQVLGIGYGTLETILQSYQFPSHSLFLLLIIKIIATSVCLGSGLVGGIFAPAMFLGACLGNIYGQTLWDFVPVSVSGAIAPSGAYAMVGMAAVLASTIKAPLTAILLLFEMTRNYLIIIPVMAAVGISVWLVETFKSTSFAQGLSLEQMGVNVQQPQDMELLAQFPIEKVMSNDFLTLSHQRNLQEAGQLLLKYKSDTAFIIDDDKQLRGVISLTDLRCFILDLPDTEKKNQFLQKSLGEICTTDVLFVYPDEPVINALEKMAIRGLHLLPVVSRENHGQLMGVIERHRIALASNLALTQDLFSIINN